MNIIHRAKSEIKGYTLIELQLASMIALIILSAIIALYIFSWRSFTIGSALLDVYSNSRNASGWLTRDIRSASQVVPSHESYTTTDNSIVLMIPSIDNSQPPNVISSHYDYITYRLQGSDLYRIVQKDALSSRQNENGAISHYCSSLTFSSGGTTLSNIGNLSAINTVAIYLPINKSTISLGGSVGVAESIIPTTIVRLRNK